MIFKLFKNSLYFDMSIINTVLKINIFKRHLIVLFLILPVASNHHLKAQDGIPAPMVEALKAGNSSKLAAFFNASIELATPDIEEIFSKQQAELIIKDFFAKHVPTNFVILHKGGKEESQYVIGNLITSSHNYRVTMLIKVKDNQSYIHQLRFEEEDAR